MAPLIIAGMHRSGTSLTASLLQKLGVNIGSQLVNPDQHNQRGYFEDVEFLEFQRKVLQACCDPRDRGWHDWGWTENDSLNRSNFQEYYSEALNLIKTRITYTGIWGWKDPRTTLMLNFWQQLLPDAKYLLVYRFPWDVADSILRLQAPVFTENPDFILKIWKYYNQQLLEFYRRNSDRALLFSINALDRFSELVEIAQRKLQIQLKIGDLEVLEITFEEHLFHEMSLDHPLVAALLQTDGELADLLEALHHTADLPPTKSVPSPLLPISSALLYLYVWDSISDKEVDKNVLEIDKNALYDQQTIAVMEKILDVHSCCVDVGCHSGEILDKMIDVAPLGKHYAFEPLPEYFTQIKKKYGQLANIYLFDAALSDWEGTSTFTNVVSNPGFSGFRQRLYLRNNLPSRETIEEIKVLITRLDRVIPEEQKIDFIKIDVEGAELEVLRGAQRILTTWKPIVVFEHGRGAAEYYNTTPEQVYDFLVETCGLVVSTMAAFLERCRPLSRQEFVDYFTEGREYYYIAYGENFPIIAKPQKLTEIATDNIILRKQLESAKDEIAAMKSSKFWKLRQLWFACKNKIGL